MARVRIETVGIDRDLRNDLAAILSPEERSRMLASAARDIIGEAERQNAAILGTVPRKDVYVDGRKDAPLESVRPDGTITAEFELINDVLDLIERFLVEYSPVKTGKYQKSHMLFADGVFVRSRPAPPADRYVFLNVQPYARRIERGWSPQAPAGVYEVAAKLAQNRFGNMARVRFGYEAPLIGPVSSWARQRSARTLARNIRGGNRALHDEWLRRQPAIIVVPR